MGIIISLEELHAELEVQNLATYLRCVDRLGKNSKNEKFMNFMCELFGKVKKQKG